MSQVQTKTAEINILQAIELVEDAMFANVVPFLRSSPALGKSSLVKAIAEKYALEVIDIRLSQCDPVDLQGFPWINTETKTASYMAMNTFPITSTPLPSGKKGWILFLDEFNSAPLSVQAASYKLVLDRMVGEHHLHENVRIVCAGNLDTDGAITSPQSSATTSRVCQLYIQPDLKVWLDWADKAGISAQLTAFLEYRPKCFYTFDSDNPDQTYASPRTYEMADRLLKRFAKSTNSQHTAILPASKIPLIAGTIGVAATAELRTFMAYQQHLPDIKQIIADPHNTATPADPGIRYALSGALAEHANENNIANLLIYINRLPVEIQIFTLRSIIKRGSPQLKAHPELRQWALKNADQFF